ncbi:PstS family phosphate ABC transporter substrate-binding protein [Lutibacter sp.]|uniref:PstS family phosphate ABC transporter substrate-binding protein n=1 Tax=Lutibacter sp. TaxID=1925666 RepID=UPI001A32A7EA|nr:PstS family phosphate ABC transporter substrate-binding protein [Lutibacter sp.]MBI9041074.1 PstS family phosphate ABC transporter substrate-binding protein [Lutibacter sp.]
MKKLVIIMSIALVMGSCGEKKADKATELTGSISIDGSGTVYPVSEAVAEEFLAIEPKVKVTVGESGTGGGFKKFATGVTDISNASRDIKGKEIELCKENGIEYIKLTVALDGITVVVNKENTWAKSMTTEELKKLWEPNSTVKKWNDIRAEWPNEEIHLYGPNTSHGTYDFFTEEIMGESGASRTDYNAVSDYNVAVQGIEKDVNALGYFGLSYYEENKDKLGVVGIDNGSGVVLPSIETVANNQYAPLSRSLFIFVNKKSAQRPEVQKFISFYLANAPKLSKEVGYVPMPQSGYDEQVKAFNEILIKQ